MVASLRFPSLQLLSALCDYNTTHSEYTDRCRRCATDPIHSLWLAAWRRRVTRRV